MNFKKWIQLLLAVPIHCKFTVFISSLFHNSSVSFIVSWEYNNLAIFVHDFSPLFVKCW